MPKMKTHKGARSRFKITGTGKLMRRQQNRGHNLTKKRPARKSRLAKDVPLSKADSKNIGRMLGISIRND